MSIGLATYESKMSLNFVGACNDLRKRVFAQDRSRVNSLASSYDQRTSRGEKD
ncbi:hypothetical protein Hanom_Chr13g01215071 [Helianthus anomalus]